MAGDKDVSMRRSFDALYLTATEIETLGMIVNALGVAGTRRPICKNAGASTKSC
jgi:hypothetical protein